jgi:hypothetical protein
MSWPRVHGREPSQVQPAVIGFDRVVRVPLDGMQGRWNQLVSRTLRSANATCPRKGLARSAQRAAAVRGAGQSAIECATTAGNRALRAVR